MRFRHRPLANIFSDKSSIVLRALLREPDRNWSMSELCGEGVSEGQVINTVQLLEEKQWVHRNRAWRNHFIRLTNPRSLMEEWTKAYRFDWNSTASYFSSDKDILSKIVVVLKTLEVPFALTMISGARLVAPYVVQNMEHIYLLQNEEDAENSLRALENRLMLPYPTGSGNIHFALPFYRNAIQREIQMIDELPVVSNLQLYLDLVNEPTTGGDQADWLRERLAERGNTLFPFKQNLPRQKKIKVA